jgi:hypothetical protein
MGYEILVIEVSNSIKGNTYAALPWMSLYLTLLLSSNRQTFMIHYEEVSSIPFIKKKYPFVNELSS